LLAYYFLFAFTKFVGNCRQLCVNEMLTTTAAPNDKVERKPMSKFLTTVAAVASAAFLSVAANAASVNTLSDISDGVADGKVAGLPGVEVSPTGFVGSWLFTAGDIPEGQSSQAIRSWINSLPAVEFDIPGIARAEADIPNGSFEFMLNVPTGANIFAVNLGQAEMLFVYDVLVNSFSIQAPKGNASNGSGWGALTNVRAYSDEGLLDGGDGIDGPGGGGASDVPLPAAVWFLLSAAGGLGIASRLRKKI
jgi:hypothetical protein